MSTAERKARKRAGIPLVKTAKTASWPPPAPQGLGLVTPAEILASIVVHGR